MFKVGDVIVQTLGETVPDRYRIVEFRPSSNNRQRANLERIFSIHSYNPIGKIYESIDVSEYWVKYIGIKRNLPSWF